MKIQLSQDEIAQAVRDYVSKGVTLSGGNQMTVDFSMGRGENGLSATIDVPYMGVSGIAALQPATAVSTPAPAPRAPAPAPAFAAQATPIGSLTSTDNQPDDSPLGVEEPATPAEAAASVTTDAPAAPPSGKSLFTSPAASTATAQ